MSYIDEQNKCGLKVGDEVKVFSKAESFENGWNFDWTRGMNKTVGKIFTVHYFNNEHGICLNTKGQYGCSINYCYPYFVLQKKDQQMVFSFMEDKYYEQE